MSKQQLQSDMDEGQLPVEAIVKDKGLQVYKRIDEFIEKDFYEFAKPELEIKLQELLNFINDLFELGMFNIDVTDNRELKDE